MKKYIILFSLLALIGCMEQPKFEELEFSSLDGIDDAAFISEEQRNSVRSILNKNCISCHGAGAQSQGIFDLGVELEDLEQDANYIKAGDADNSLFYQKINVGSMARYLGTNDDKLIIKNWINDLDTITPTDNCFKKNPTITLSQSSFAGEAGSSFSYDVTIKNNSFGCDDALYNLSYSALAAGFTSPLPSSQLIKSGESKNMTIQVTTSNVAGMYAAILNAVDAGDSGYTGMSSLSFDMSPIPVPFVLNSVSSDNVLENSARIKFVLSSGGVGKVEFGTSVNLGSVSAETTNFALTDQSINLSNLVSNTTYYYKVVARNQSGVLVSSSIMNFNTPVGTPTCLRANPTLTLTPASFNQYTNENFNYELKIKNNNQYCPDASYGLSYVNLPAGFTSDLPVSKTIANGDESTITVGLTSGTTVGDFQTSLRAVDNANSNYSASSVLNFSITAENTMPPAAPVLISAILEGENYVLVFSQPANTLAPAGGYDTWVNNANQNDSATYSGFARILTGLDKNIRQCFKLRARYTQSNPQVSLTSNEVCVEAYVAPAATLAELRVSVRSLLDANCINCHGAGAQYQSQIDLAVDVTVLEQNVSYITKNDPANSYFYTKVTTGSMRNHLPLVEDRNIIRDWINAMDDSEGPPVTCPAGEEALDNVCVTVGKVFRSHGYRMVTPTEMFKDINSIFNVALSNKDVESGQPIVPEPQTTHGFENQYGLISANSVYINAVEKVANLLGTALDEKADFDPTIVNCMNETTVNCGMTLANTYIPKLFRRPLASEDLTVYQTFFTNATGEKKAIFINFFKALIQSPSFIFREEHGQNPNPLHNLDAYEVASRMAFFITGKSPDAMLRSKAANGSLLTKAMRESEALRLMSIDSSKEHLTSVFLESIGIKKLKHAENLSADMKKETTKLVKEIFFDGTKAWTDVFTTDYTYVNSRLAAIYNINANTNTTNFIKVDYPDNKRSGILSHASYLSAFYTGSDLDKTKDVRRGINFFEKILCKSMPLPPADVDIDQDPSDELNGCRIDNRKASTFNPGGTCFQCHQHFDPIGLGFERFDNEGRYREVQGDNSSCSTVEKFYLSGGQEFTTMPAYTQAISQDARVGRCLALKMKSFAYGSEGAAEHVNSVYLEMGRFKTSKSFIDLIVDIVGHEQFIKRESRDE